MNRMIKKDFVALLEKIEGFDADTKASLGYFAGLALQHARYGKNVYVHAGMDKPEVEGLYIENTRFGRSNNTYSREVHIAPSGAYCNFGETRLRAIISACA